MRKQIEKIFIILCIFSSISQAKTIDILTGSIVDMKGRPVSEYDVTIKNIDTGDSNEIITDDAGVFELYKVEHGNYYILLKDNIDKEKKAIKINDKTRTFGNFKLNFTVSVNINNEAEQTIPENIRKTINPEAAYTINAEAAEHITPEVAKKINAQAAQTISPEVAKSINPDAARTINPEAAKTINPEAAKTINPEAARVINPDIARNLNPERAKTLTRDEAKKLTIEEASTPPD